jgi:hypothetical protein
MGGGHDRSWSSMGAHKRGEEEGEGEEWQGGGLGGQLGGTNGGGELHGGRAWGRCSLCT